MPKITSLACAGIPCDRAASASTNITALTALYVLMQIWCVNSVIFLLSISKSQSALARGLITIGLIIHLTLILKELPIGIIGRWN